MCFAILFRRFGLAFGLTFSTQQGTKTLVGHARLADALD